MTRPARRAAFTLLELMISMLVLGMMSFASWQLMRGGLLETSSASEYLSAIQNAMLLMENIQEDCRQIAILNEGGGNTVTAPLLHYSLEFSKNAKSCMFRKSSRADARNQTDAGSAFTVVVYQLVKRPEYGDAYTIRRLEKSADGAAVVGANRAQDDKAFKALVLKDIRWDFVTRLEGMATFRTFLRVSLTVVNTALAANATPSPRDPKYYFLSNVFELESPEPLHSTLAFPAGFARKFIRSKHNIKNGTNITAGKGYLDILPPTSFGDRATNWVAWDYYDPTSNSAKDFPTATTAAGDDPFDTASAAGPQIRKEFIMSSVEYLKEILSGDFRGRVTGKVSGRAPGRGQPPPWTLPYSFDCSESAKEPLAKQINDVLEKVIPKGAEAVAEMGHAFRAAVPTARAQKPPPPNLLGSVGAIMITTDQARLLVEGK